MNESCTYPRLRSVAIVTAYSIIDADPDCVYMRKQWLLYKIQKTPLYKTIASRFLSSIHITVTLYYLLCNKNSSVYTLYCITSPTGSWHDCWGPQSALKLALVETLRVASLLSSIPSQIASICLCPSCST